ncbi:MAG: transposase [Lachnospiraceae bacterium]|nr:transposase [Lachnospiraceae bacterium]
MAGKDITEKALEAFDDVFSDIVNVLLFDGEERVREGELEQGRERGYYTGDRPIREQERDSSKYWRHNSIRIAYVGLENETEAEDDVPFRVIGYDGAAYRDQVSYSVDADGKRHKKAAKFKSDFRILVDYLVQMRKNGNYVPDDGKIDHVRETLNLMSFVTNDSRFRESLESTGEGDEPKNMCAVLDRIENRGIQIGRDEGIQIGRDEGIQIGRQEGQDETKGMMAALVSAGRSEDVVKASTDADFFNQVLREYREGKLENFTEA